MAIISVKISDYHDNSPPQTFTTFFCSLQKYDNLGSPGDLLTERSDRDLTMRTMQQ